MNYIQEVLSNYKVRRVKQTLSARLLIPTPSGLKEECLCVYREKKLPKSDKLLRSFFGSLDNEDDYLQRIGDYDVDKFKPLVNFLNGKTTKTNIKNVDLLFWLMFNEKEADIQIINLADENNSGESGEKSLKGVMPGNNGNENCLQSIIDEQRKPIIIYSLKQLTLIGIVLLITVGGYFLVWKDHHDSQTITENEKCMYWTGKQYEAISCDLQSEAIKINLNIGILNGLKKIDNYDKLTKNDLGKVWYSNIDKELEFFTQSGMHPVDTRKRLKPLTSYILNKYVSYHRYLLNILTRSLGLGITIFAMLYFTVSYFKKTKASKRTFED